MIDGRVVLRSRNLLYGDEVGRDACGIGGGAAREGRPSPGVVRKASLALKSVAHRGGVCGQSGDGAGLTLQLPQTFFKEEAKRLGLDGARQVKREQRLAVGVFFFFEADPARRDRAKALVGEVLSGGPVQVLGWRPVPVNPDVLPPEARATRPVIEQLVLLVEKVTGSVTSRLDPSEIPAINALERHLYRCRLELRHRFAQAGLDVYVPSLSAF